MCITRSWNSFNIVERTATGEKFIYANRSDGQMLAFIDKYSDVTTFLQELESYRNCKCSQSTPCSIHLTNKKEN